MTDYNLILSSKLSQAGETLTPKARTAVNQAIVDCAIVAVESYKSIEAKAITGEAIKLIPAIFKGELTLRIRQHYLKRAKIRAQMEANTQNRKIYVIRKSELKYETVSTGQVDHLKKIGVFGKNVTAMRLEELSDFVAYPQQRVDFVRVIKRASKK